MSDHLDDDFKCLRCGAPAEFCWFDGTQFSKKDQVRGFCVPCHAFVTRWQVWKKGRVEVDFSRITFINPDEMICFLILDC